MKPNEITDWKAIEYATTASRLTKGVSKAAKAEMNLRKEILSMYCEIFGADKLHPANLNHYVSICKQCGPERLFDWMTIASNKRSLYGETNIVRYVHGIKRKVLEAEACE